LKAEQLSRRERLTRLRRAAAESARFWIVLHVLLGMGLAAITLIAMGSACRDATTSAVREGQILGVIPIAAEVCRGITQNPPWFLISGLVAGPCVLLTWFWRDEKRRNDHRLALETGAAARYTKAAELLSSKELMTRINGLFALWDLARESPTHRVTVARTLSAFIAMRTEISEESYGEGDGYSVPADDVQSAARILADNEWSKPEWQVDGRRIRLDLRRRDLQGFDLAGLNLDGANLAGALLWHSNLEEASLRGANLTGCNLSAANLRRCALQGATLNKVYAMAADLDLAKLNDALIEDARMNGSSFRIADLTDAKLAGANFERANFDHAILRFAVYGTDTIFPEGFDPLAHGMMPPAEAELTGQARSTRKASAPDQ
jgi:hypothetical protein